MKAKLVLENGMSFFGELFGAEKEAVGEVVFSTGMVGYQEAMTNPASLGQITIMTFPMIGNYGTNAVDMESDKATMTALVVRERCDFPSNFRCEKTLDEFMKEQGVVGLCGIDTRALTRAIRDNGTMKGAIVCEGVTDEAALEKIKAFDNSDAVKRASTDKKYIYSDKGTVNVAVLDLGCNRKTLAAIADRDCKVTVFPSDTTADEILAIKPNVVFVSGGPGSPDEIETAVDTVRKLLGVVKICGVSLGHLVIALALGCETQKLKFGHHGSNYPVKLLDGGKVLITSQNIDYVVSKLAADVTETVRNVNDGTVAGFECKAKNAEAVLFNLTGGSKEFEDGFILDRFLGKAGK